MSNYLESFSPWTSRSNTPKIGKEKDGSEGQGQAQQGGDHSVSHRHQLNLRDYPEDCPKAAVRWFYAVDVRRSKDTVSLQKDI